VTAEPAHSSGAIPRILIADSDSAVRECYRLAFSEDGCDVIEAEDGRDALVKALVREPTLIITDLQLSLLSGLDLCEILRRDRVTANVPILVSTSSTTDEVVDRARHAGADVVLPKSTPIRTIVNEARRLIADSHALRERSAAARERAAQQLERASPILSRAKALRVHLAQTKRSFGTTLPPVPPPPLMCPTCGSAMAYQYSHIGGVGTHREQWDYYSCGSCAAMYQYRERTQKVRRVE